MGGIFSKKKIKEKVKDTKVDRLVTLIVLDGFGVHPDAMGNAILASKTPFLDAAWTYGKSTLIHAAGTDVGLPNEVVGNSEVGHLNMGAGQVVYQSLPRINEAIARHELEHNNVVSDMFKHIESHGSRLHLVGVLSSAGVHGHIKHLFSILELCKEHGVDPFIHIILDGRDTPPTEGFWYLNKLKKKMEELGIGHIASMMGRFYGMDRDTRWERTKLAYDAMVGLSNSKFVDPIKALQESYTKDITDQFFLPSVAVDLRGKLIGKVQKNDAILFWNFREDRARQLTKVFVVKEWSHFTRRDFPENIHFVTMTGYEEGLPAKVIFPPNKVKMPLAEYLADNGINQLHVSETEKHMHVTYFFNGGAEKEHIGEDFFNIPSPRVNDYSMTPAMSAQIIRDETVKRIKENLRFNYGFILINFANPDMLGHTGNFRATVRANEITDSCTADIARATLDLGGAVIITADHGNCETMINRITREVDVAHTNNPVPFIILESKEQIQGKDGRDAVKIGTGDSAKTTGILADVAPTVLGVMGVDLPGIMTGMNLDKVI
ncbi:TPA: 2,3-bisphosphoglycerate-independent phosphoglycerate mutase [Patescibacteria group bacterium]|nr:2,3-bisphosphoglycerate-independent phosphoglycerate mutase [Patescibacteria group bacterium]